MKATLIIMIAIFVVCSLAHAGDLEPDTAPAPTMKTLQEVEPRKPISSLPYTIDTSGSYYLTSDLNSADTGITVTVDNVTLDLMGHTITGSGKYGIYMNGRENVEIKNGTVRGFADRGVYDDYNGGGNRIINIRALSNGGAGIILMGNSHLVKECIAAHNGHAGIYVLNDCTVTGSKVHNNSFAGIYAQQGCLISGNTMYNNSSRGMQTGSGCTIIGNTAYNHTNADGIMTGEGCTIAHNSTYDNHVGIKAGTGCSVIGNTAYSNNLYGIDAGHSNMVDQNSAYSNGTQNLRTGSNCALGVNVF
jgi:parallel beta-helix repeat protein